MHIGVDEVGTCCNAMGLLYVTFRQIINYNIDLQVGDLFETIRKSPTCICDPILENQS